jgi:hypothetical protein
MYWLQTNISWETLIQHVEGLLLGSANLENLPWLEPPLMSCKLQWVIQRALEHVFCGLTGNCWCSDPLLADWRCSYKWLGFAWLLNHMYHELCCPNLTSTKSDKSVRIWHVYVYLNFEWINTSIYDQKSHNYFIKTWPWKDRVYCSEGYGFVIVVLGSFSHMTRAVYWLRLMNWLTFRIRLS